MTKRPSLDPETRQWLKGEVSRRRREKELHVGRPVLHRYSKQDPGDDDERLARESRTPDGTSTYEN